MTTADADRRVRTLRIRAPNEEQARRAAIVAEDALRTASFPGDGDGRVVFIRRLDVGVIPRGSPPSSIALAMEAAVQRLSSASVHAEAPGAREAPMVYFRDPSEPVVALARAIAFERRTDAWFWPLAVRGWSPAVGPAESLRLLVRRALDTAAGVVAAAQVIATLLEAERGEAIVDALSESEARGVLADVGFAAGDDDVRPEFAAPVGVEVRRAVERVVARTGGRVGDPRVVLVAVMMVIAERPGRAASPLLGAIVSGVMRAVEREGVEVKAESSGVEPSEWRASGVGMVGAGLDGWQRSGSRYVDSQTGGAPRPPGTNTTESTSPPAPPHSAAASDIPLPPPHIWENPRPTDRAGFLFLVALLQQLGIANLLAAHPDLIETGWSEDLLLRLARRLGISPDDPIIAWLTPPPPAPLPPAGRALTAIWLHRIRGHLRHQVGKTLASIVHRRGAIVATRTHVDILMRHSQVDMAIRRAGLDLDLGWLPWLGRVVQFHYLDALPIDAPA